MTALGAWNLLLVATLALQTPSVHGMQVHTYNLCFPTMTRHLKDDELFTFEKLTNHYLHSEDVPSPSAFFVAQAFAPHRTVKTNIARGSNWYVIKDDAARWTPFRSDACMTVTVELGAHDAEQLPKIWLDPHGNNGYMSLLRLGMAQDLLIPSDDGPSSTITTTTSERGDDITTTTTTTTTTVMSRNGTWIWTIATVLIAGSVTMVTVWHIYLRPSPMRYLRKNESEDGTTDPHWPDHGEPDDELDEEECCGESSCISFCTSS